MMSIPAKKIYPRTGDKQTVYLDAVVKDPISEVATAWDNKGDIVIDSDVWIGYEAAILSDVHIGDGAIIGTRAVVTRDMEPYSIVGGVPAKLIQKRYDPETIRELEALRWWDLPFP